MPRTTDPITLATARKMALTSLSGVESRLAAEREYVSHDPHTVALLKPDALKRLEGWMLGRPLADALRWVRWINPPIRKNAKWKVVLVCGYYGVSVEGTGKTLALAIHAALDVAEAKP